MVEFPNGHNFSNLFHMFYGKKIAIGINTMTQPKCFGWWLESIGLKVRNLTLPSSFSSMYKDIHTFIYEEHSCATTWLLFVTPFISLGWQNKKPKQIKQEALQFTKYFQILELELCINNTTFEHFTKNTL